jgi:hypothetical protein
MPQPSAAGNHFFRAARVLRGAAGKSTGLHELFEATEIFVQLLIRRFAEKLGDGRTERTRGRLILQRDLHPG